MTILEAIKHDRFCLRVNYGSKWLTWEDWLDVWRVYEKKKYKTTAKILIETTNEEEAVKELLKD